MRFRHGDTHLTYVVTGVTKLQLGVVVGRHQTRTFVLATPISGPAFMWMPQSVSRDSVDPAVLVIPRVMAPRLRQYLNASSVSAVSPD